MSATQFVILSKQDATGQGLAPLGSRATLIRELAHYNTAPERPDDADMLYGPGIQLEFPPGAPGQGDVNQALLTVVEEEIAWLVIMRLAKAFNWKIVDTSSGRELNA